MLQCLFQELYFKKILKDNSYPKFFFIGTWNLRNASSYENNVQTCPKFIWLMLKTHNIFFSAHKTIFYIKLKHSVLYLNLYMNPSNKGQNMFKCPTKYQSKIIFTISSSKKCRSRWLPLNTQSEGSKHNSLITSCNFFLCYEEIFWMVFETTYTH